MQKNNKIIIISSVNLSVNPRALKEIYVASQMFKKVVFIGFDIGGWTRVIEKENIAKLPENVTTIYISATRIPFLPWIASFVIQKFNVFLYYFKKKSLKTNAYASNKRSFLLQLYLEKNKKLLENADLISVHTLATLYPVFNFCEKYNIPFGFDAEDYHPGEYIEKDAKNEKRRRELLMKKIIPQASFLTYASPLIGEHVIKLTAYKGPHFLINNSFPFSEFENIKEIKGLNRNNVNLVWFSQNISAGRGIELFLPIMEKLEKFHLYLIGNLDDEFAKKYNLHTRKNITIVGVMPQQKLHQVLGCFDVGLALDYSEKDMNRSLALTNKIFAYYQAGLHIFAFKTPAQENFINTYNCGFVEHYKNQQKIIEEFNDISVNIDTIRKNKSNQKIKAKDIAWENERKKLTYIWSKLMEK